LLILNGRRDPYFPPTGFREAGRKIRRIYALHGGAATDRMREVEANTGHEEVPEFHREVRAWMRHWLMPDAGAVNVDEMESAARAAEPSELACLEEAPAMAVNYHVHETFVRPASPTIPENNEALRVRRGELMAELRRTVFAWFPQGAIPFATRVVSTRPF
jgi:hypothetical protein